MATKPVRWGIFAAPKASRQRRLKSGKRAVFQGSGGFGAGNGGFMKKNYLFCIFPVSAFDCLKYKKS
jgi:hypothetical protein